MSREPQSAAHRYNQALGESGGARDVPAKPKPPATKPKPGPMRAIPSVPAAKRNPVPDRDTYKTKWSDLTPEEMTSFVIYPKDKS